MRVAGPEGRVRKRQAASTSTSSVLQKTNRTRDRPPSPSRKKLEPGTGVTPISRDSQTANSVSVSIGSDPTFAPSPGVWQPRPRPPLRPQPREIAEDVVGPLRRSALKAGFDEHLIEQIPPV